MRVELRVSQKGPKMACCRIKGDPDQDSRMMIILMRVRSADPMDLGSRSRVPSKVYPYINTHARAW